jgi:hypothetical protein
VLVCRQHYTGIVNLDRHLREQHGTPITVRRLVIEHFARFSAVKLSTVELLEQPAAQIQELRVLLDGMQCKACSFITVNINSIKKHCYKSHELSWTGDKSTLYKSVKVQTFFKSGGLQKYFIINLGEVENEENLDPNQVVQ